ARVERRYAGPAVAADDEQLLARRSVPSRRIAVDATVAHIQAFDGGVPRAPALDDYKTVILQRLWRNGPSGYQSARRTIHVSLGGRLHGGGFSYAYYYGLYRRHVRRVYRRAYRRAYYGGGTITVLIVGMCVEFIVVHIDVVMITDAMDRRREF